jgi:Na+/H+-dicarboxylate symporter
VAELVVRFSLSTSVLLGFMAGIAGGLLAGEYCAPLGVVGDIYVGLLQMTVLPYIVVSLIVNLGRLDMATCRRLAAAASSVLAILWLLMAILLLMLPLALPEWRSGTFFAVGMFDTPPQIDLLRLFIPTNPFQASAENVVPAAVLFSMCLGIGLIGVENKQPLLDNLQTILKTLGRINHAVAFIRKMYDYWILGRGAEEKQSRWCILRDVLGWIR